MEVIYSIYFAILVVAILSGLYRMAKLSPASKILLWQVMLTCIVEVMAYISLKQWGHNLSIYHVFIPIDFLLISLAYHRELKQPYLIYTSLLIGIWAMMNALFFQPFLEKFPSNVILLTSFFTVLWTLVFFRTLLKNFEDRSFTAYPLFWISCGWLFFDTVNLFSFGSYAFLHQNASAEFISIVSTLRYFTNYLLYMLYSVAFWSRQQTLFLRNE